MKLRYVGNAPFFSALTEQEQERVSERMHLEHHRGGETLFRKGSDSACLYLIKSGWVRLVGDGGTVLASQGPGSLVGETDLFLERPHSIGATLTTDAELWVLSRQDLLELIAEAPQLGLKLTLAFGSRLAVLDRHLVEHRLRSLPFLSGLGPEALRAVARRLILVEKKKGEFIVEGGQLPEALFIVEAGQVHLESSEEGGDFSELGTGETFGELAILTGKPHSRSAQAASDVVLWALPASEFESLAEEQPDVRLALSKTIREPLLPEDQSRAVQRLAAMSLFANLPEDALWAVADRLLLHHVPAGELVFSEGSPGDALYLIESGQIEIVSDGTQAGTVLARLGADEFFGEMALLTGKPRSTAARAATHANLWVLYRSDFDDLVNRHPAISLALSRVLSERLAEMDRRFTETHLRGMKLLTTLSPGQLEDVSRRLKPVRYRQGEVIIREGAPGDQIYFMESGRVRVVRGSGAGALVLADLEAGDLFGEMALLTGRPRSATVTALTDVDLWSLSQADFDDLVTAYPNLALALSRLLSDRLQHTDERFLQQPVAPAAAAAARPQPVGRPAARAAPLGRPARPAPVPRPAPQPSLATQPTVTLEPTLVLPRAARPPARVRPARRRPERGLMAAVGAAFGGAVTWFGSLSTGAKIRLIVVTLLLVWLLFVAAPALVISTLLADNVTNLTGAVAFVQTVPSPVTDGSSPTDAPSPPEAGPAAPAKVPIQPAAPAPTEVGAEPVAQVGAPPAGEPQPAVPTPVPPTPTPWIVVITNTPLPVTDTPELPTDTPEPPTPTPKPRLAAPAAPAPTATAAPRKQPARSLDSRLDSLRVTIEPAGVRPGQQYWRLIEVRWENEQQAGGGHSIFVTLLDEGGNRLIGQPVEIRWQDGTLTVLTEDKPPPEYTANFPMYNVLGSYAVSVPGLPSDVVHGLGLGTAEQPAFKVHTNFFLIFQRVTY